MLHLAALIAIPYSYVAPRSYVETNVIGTLNVLEAVRRHGTPRMVNTSTSEVYGTPEHVPITEAHPLRGQSPYSASKIGADKMCESYALSFDTPVTTLRPFNTFGPRQSARAVIPTVLSQLLAGADEIRLGDVTPKRDFTFVTDTADGFVRAAVARPRARARPSSSAPGRTVSVGEVVDLCRTVTGSSARIVTDEARIRPEGSEVQVLLSDPSRAAAELGWRADRLPRGRPRRDGRVAAAAGRPHHRRAVPPMSGRRRGEAHAPGARDPRAPSRSPCPNIGELERDYVLRAVESGFVSSVGPFVAEFEDAFAAPRRRPVRRGVRVGHGRPPRRVPRPRGAAGRRGALLRLHLRRLGRTRSPTRARDRCSSTPSARTWNLDPALVAAELDRRAGAGERQPAAVEVVHVLGQPADLAPRPRRVRPARRAGRRGRRRVARRRVVGRGPGRPADGGRRPRRGVLVQRQQDRDDRAAAG